MSVYSGFATRNQQTYYNKLLQTLVIALKKRILKIYRDQPCDQNKFQIVIRKLYKKLRKAQQNKYMAPKFGLLIDDLITTMGIEINWDSSSTASFLNISKLTFKVDEKTYINRQKSRQNQSQKSIRISRKQSINQFNNNNSKHLFSSRNKSISQNDNNNKKTNLFKPPYVAPLQTILQRQSQSLQPTKGLHKKFNFIKNLRLNAFNQQSQTPIQVFFSKQLTKLQAKPQHTNYLYQSKKSSSINHTINPQQSYIKIRKNNIIQKPSTQRQQDQSWLGRSRLFTKGKTSNVLNPIKMPDLRDYLPNQNQPINHKKWIRNRQSQDQQNSQQGSFTKLKPNKFMQTVRFRRNAFHKQKIQIQNID